MTMREIEGTVKAMGMIYHLQGHMQEMAERETGTVQEALKCAYESLGLAAQSMNSAVVAALIGGGGADE